MVSLIALSEDYGAELIYNKGGYYIKKYNIRFVTNIKKYDPFQYGLMYRSVDKLTPVVKVDSVITDKLNELAQLLTIDNDPTFKIFLRKHKIIRLLSL